MPLYMLAVHPAAQATSRPPPDEEQMREWMGRIDALESRMKEQGAWFFSAQLTGVESATVVDATGERPVTTDGPFVEAKEHLGGFYLVQAEDLDAALEWATSTSECVGMPIEVRALADHAGL